MQVEIKYHLEPVSDGKVYKGYVEIANTKFDCKLVFGISIPKLSKKPFKKEDVRRIFQITIKRGDSEIELEDWEYGFFFEMLVDTAVNLYKCQSEDSRGETVSVRYGFTADMIQMLKSPKFGCAI